MEQRKQQLKFESIIDARLREWSMPDGWTMDRQMDGMMDDLISWAQLI